MCILSISAIQTKFDRQCWLLKQHMTELTFYKDFVIYVNKTSVK